MLIQWSLNQQLNTPVEALSVSGNGAEPQGSRPVQQAATFDITQTSLC